MLVLRALFKGILLQSHDHLARLRQTYYIGHAAKAANPLFEDWQGPLPASISGVFDADGVTTSLRSQDRCLGEPEERKDAALYRCRL